MEELKRAIILAAGEGSRLRPVSLETPKPLVSVNGIRLIDTSIQALKENDIHEIYIVAGYKKEQFHNIYKNDPNIKILDNPYYLKGNNITSLYIARAYIPGSFVLEGDLRIYNESILNRFINKSGYCVNWISKTDEWVLDVEKGSIKNCKKEGGTEAYRLWGVSMWTEEDGKRLSELVRKQIEDTNDWSRYWDEIALFEHKSEFDLGIREIDEGDIIEIDSLKELVSLDPSYMKYLKQ